jgi:hypothetical protein
MNNNNINIKKLAIVWWIVELLVITGDRKCRYKSGVTIIREQKWLIRG